MFTEPSPATLFLERRTGRRQHHQKGVLQMLQLLSSLQTWLASRDERGATAVEYGVMVALIAAAIVLTVTALGTSLNGIFTSVKGTLDSAV
jgi:pilus assembly protein Flp/PilA